MTSTNQTTDNSQGIIPPTVDGQISGGSVNYQTEQVQLNLTPAGINRIALITVQLGNSTSRILPENQSHLTFMLPNFIQKGSVTVIFDGSQISTDDELGHFIASQPLLGGEVDYVIGRVELIFQPDSTATHQIQVKCSTLEFLRPISNYNNDPDLDVNQLNFTLGGIVGVKYVQNTDVPVAAQTTDQHLFRRDLVLYEILTNSDSIFSKLPASADGLFDVMSENVRQNPTIPNWPNSGGSTTQAWSQAQSCQNFSLPLFDIDWGTGVYANPDKYLAWRDNSIAFFIALLSRFSTSTLTGQSTLQVLGTQSGIPIRVSDNTTTPDAPTPPGSCYASNIVQVAADNASQSGFTVSFSTINTSILQIGDQIQWLSASAVIYEILTSNTVGVYPQQTVSTSPATIFRNLTVIDTPRALRISPTKWQCQALGAMSILGSAQKLLIRVNDATVNEYQQDIQQTVIGAVGCHGLSGSNQTSVANVVTSWSPEAILFLGNSNFYIENSGNFYSNNAVYTSYTTNQLVFPCIGDNDYYPNPQSGTDISEYESFFYYLPGNGRYYTKVISSDVQVFVLNAGWNENQAAIALGDPNNFTSQEPDGITPSGTQAAWLQNALANSTATWKIVVVHFPPYVTSSTSNNSYPGWSQLRWPFKQWGANLVLSGHVRAYEKLLVDGLIYVNSGTGGESVEQFQRPYGTGTVSRNSDSTSAMYGALKITATPNWIKVDAYTTALDLPDQTVDSFTLWKDPLAQDFQNLAYSVEEDIVKINDLEYSPATDRFIVRAPKREAEVFNLTNDIVRYRTFNAQPQLPNNLKTLIYDTWLKSVQWRTEQSSDVPVLSASAQQFQGIREGQVVEILAQPSAVKDAEYWRQKAAGIPNTPCQEKIITYNSFPPVNGVPSIFIEASSQAKTLNNSPAIFLQGGGIVQIENLDISSLLPTVDAQWWQINLLLQPVTSWYRAASTYYPSLSTGSISIKSDGITLAVQAPSPTNSFQSQTNIPTITWQATMPVGNYNVQLEWLDLTSTPAAYFVTVWWNNQIVFNGTWQNANNSLNLSPQFQISSNGELSTLSVTFNSPSTASGVNISRLLFNLTSNSQIDNYRVNLNFFDLIEDSVDMEIPAQYFRFSSDVNLPEVASTAWIPATTVGYRNTLNFTVSLLDTPQIPLALTGVELRTRLKVEPIPHWQSYPNVRNDCLRQALQGIVDHYVKFASTVDIRIQTGSTYTWTSVTTAAWLNQFVGLEPRLKLAFRPAAPGDIGKPALAPRGVYWSNGTIVADYPTANCIPYLTPWQPWMQSLNFLVASEDFWNVQLPSNPTTLIMIDPSGQDIANYSPLAPSLIFIAPVESQYVPLT